MGGGPPSRIPPYIGVVDKKRGDNTIDEIFWKFFWEKGSIHIFIIKLNYEKDC
jgi:hypothetical protein